MLWSRRLPVGWFGFGKDAEIRRQDGGATRASKRMADAQPSEMKDVEARGGGVFSKKLVVPGWGVC